MATHGADFVVLGRRTDLVWLDASLKEYWDTKSELFGPPGETQCVHQARILGRRVTWKKSGIELEADPRLAELVVKSLGVLNANGKVTTPIVKEKAKSTVSEASTDVPDGDSDVDVDEEEATLYRSNAMRVNFLGQDRPEL